MANYSAVIDLRVTGQGGLDAVKNRLDAINNLIKNVKPVPSLFDRRANAEILRAKDLLADVVKKYAEGGQASARFATSIAGINQQLQSFKTVANNAKVGTEEFNDALTAAALGSNRLLRAELERAQALQNVYTKTSFATKQPTSVVADLLALKKTVPDSISALERYQQELKDVQRSVSMTSTEFEELGVAINQVDALLGKVQFGPAKPPATPTGKKAAAPKATGPAPGSLAFNPRPSAENLALGAGFPLLFGGGPAQVGGGLFGSMFGAGFGGQILGAAVAQQLSDVLVRVKDIGSAAKELNMDALRDSVVYVNAELETSLRLLVEAGQADKARAIAAEEAAYSLGLTTEAMQDINKATSAVQGEWQKFVGAITGTLAIIGAPFAAALAGALRGITLAVQGFNMIQTYIFGIVKRTADWAITTLGLKGVVDNIGKSFGYISEEEQKRVASLTRTNEQLIREVGTRKQILSLEAQRTLGRTEAEKLINAELTKQQAQIQIKAEYAQKELDLRNELANITSESGKREIELALKVNEAKERQALKEQAIKDLIVAQGLEIEANVAKYQLAAEAIQRQIDALDRGQQVKQSQFAVEAALNDLYGAQLERQYQLAETAGRRYEVAVLQFRQQVKAAEIEYRLALSNNEILVQKAVLQTRLIELKYKELQAEKEIALAQAGSRGNTPQQIAAIAGSYDKALGVQKEVVMSAYDQLKATKEIATNQNQVAKAVYQTKLIQAESALAQKLASDEIGMSKRQADALAYSLRVAATEAFLTAQKAQSVVGVIEVGTQRTYVFAQAMSNVAAAANDAAFNIDRAFRAQLNLNTARANQPGSAPTKRAAEGAYWAGGFTAFAQGGMVTGPTLGLVGEGGEAEYIIPASKMATAASNYLAGGRGAGILEGGGGGADPVINIQTGPVMEMNGERYVTMSDFERGMRQVAGSVYAGLRTPAGRYATGVR